MSEGAGSVEVCAAVLQGSLDRELILELSTSDKTAQSKYKIALIIIDSSRFMAVKEI